MEETQNGKWIFHLAFVTRESKTVSRDPVPKKRIQTVVQSKGPSESMNMNKQKYYTVMNIYSYSYGQECF
jgi:hypothetical protein